jgi:hypothetical protein
MNITGITICFETTHSDTARSANLLVFAPVLRCRQRIQSIIGGVMLLIVGAMITYGLIAIAIMREPGTEAGESGGPSSSGSGSYHQ